MRKIEDVLIFNSNPTVEQYREALSYRKLIAVRMKGTWDDKRSQRQDIHLTFGVDCFPIIPVETVEDYISDEVYQNMVKSQLLYRTGLFIRRGDDPYFADIEQESRPKYPDPHRYPHPEFQLSPMAAKKSAFVYQILGMNQLGYSIKSIEDNRIELRNLQQPDQVITLDNIADCILDIEFHSKVNLEELGRAEFKNLIIR